MRIVTFRQKGNGNLIEKITVWKFSCCFVKLGTMKYIHLPSNNK